MKYVKIYTDGACSGNPGPGGWGALLIYKDYEKQIYGGESATTNNRMELKAAIKALESLNSRCLIDLYTDSNYLKEGVTKWIINWQKNNWKTANNKPVKNVDLWKDLQSLIDKHQINWHWVKGHAGIEGNERADKLAIKGCKEASCEL